MFFLCQLYLQCILVVGILTEVGVHEGDLKIEFLYPYGPRKTLKRPSVTDKCFVGVSNILWVITAPTISGNEFEQTLKAYENHKM